MVIDTNFNFHSDSNGGDPDLTSPTLRKFHKILWSKPLPNGKIFELSDNKPGAYLYHNSEVGEFFLGSDAITHSYRHHKRKQWIIRQIQEDVDELFETGSNIASYIIFPNKKIDGNLTINQARGVNKFIDDRFDLTLECIRRFYLGQDSPLFNILLAYKNFFDIFENFGDYIEYFLIQDLVDKNNQIKFYLPFDDFKSQPRFSQIQEYLKYKEGILNFNQLRKNRIENYLEQRGINNSDND